MSAQRTDPDGLLLVRRIRWVADFCDGARARAEARGDDRMAVWWASRVADLQRSACEVERELAEAPREQDA